MEEEAHVDHHDLVGVGEQFVCGVISELSWSERVEAADPAEQPRLVGELFVDEGGEWPQRDQPCPLDVVHLLDK